jgi:hypothetical protein
MSGELKNVDALPARPNLLGQARVAQAVGVSSATRLIGKSAKPGSTEAT